MKDIRPIFLDHNATTPLDPQVLELMLPYLREEFGNPASSSHSYGWKAKAAVEKARKQVAAVLGADSKDIIFTSGATESNNMAILGLCQKWRGEKSHLITSAVEHKAVLQVCQVAADMGAELTVLPVDSEGLVRMEDLKAAIQPNTKLVSIMAANNEIGVINSISEIGKLCKEKGILFHTDAAQAFGKVPLDVKAMNIDLLSISGHKIYGPKGVGALFINRSKEEALPHNICFGGEQECGIRPGTLNVPGIVGLGAASEIALACMESENLRLQQYRDLMIDKILGEVPIARLNGSKKLRLCNNLSFSFEGLNSDIFSLGLSGLAISSGSACTSSSAQPSHVLMALGHSVPLARATVRIGLGRHTTLEEVEKATDKIIQMYLKNKAISVL